MSTIGNKAATQHVSLQKQTITGNGGTSYSLQQSVGSALDIAVFINNTRQEPTVAYSASGTTLTMTGAVNASDNFYVIFLGKAITTTGLPIDAVGTANINAGAITGAKIASSTIDLTSKVTGSLPVANGGTGLTAAKPSFDYQSSSNGSTMLMDGGGWDTWVNSVTNLGSPPYANNGYSPDGETDMFDATTGIMTCKTAGTYFFNATAALYYPGSTNTSYLTLAYRTNSSASFSYGVSGYALYYSSSGANWLHGSTSFIANLTVGNQVCVYGYSSGASNVQMNNHHFMGFMI